MGLFGCTHLRKSDVRGSQSGRVRDQGNPTQLDLVLSTGVGLGKGKADLHFKWIILAAVLITGSEGPGGDLADRILQAGRTAPGQCR